MTLGSTQARSSRWSASIEIRTPWQRHDYFVVIDAGLPPGSGTPWFPLMGGNEPGSILGLDFDSEDVATISP